MGQSYANTCCCVLCSKYSVLFRPFHYRLALTSDEPDLRSMRMEKPGGHAVRLPLATMRERSTEYDSDALSSALEKWPDARR